MTRIYPHELLRSRSAHILPVMALVIALILSLSPRPAFGNPFNQLPYQLGFENGKVLSGAAVWYASPTLADLDGDGKQEIIVGGRDGMVYAVRSDGALLWQFNTADALNAVVLTHGQTAIDSTPAVGDIDRDGWLEVVVGLTAGGTGYNAGMIVLSHDGKLKPGWPQLSSDHERDGYTDGIYSSPALGDLDGDGDLEIVAGSWDMNVYAWHHDGRLVSGWPRFAFDTVWSSPTLADLDRDGCLEVIIGTDAHGAGIGGYLHVYRGDGTEMQGFPKEIDQTIYSSPAIADLDGDGWLDIVVGTGNFYLGKGYAVYAWDRYGNSLAGWPAATGSYVLSSPTVGDIDGDGRPEVIVGCNDGKVYAFHGNGSRVSGWPVLAQDNLGNTGPLNFSSPVLANFDSDSLPEVFINHYCDTVVIDGNGTLLTHVGNSGPSGKPSMYMFYAWCLGTTPAVADIDGDGRLEVVRVGGSNQSTGGDALLYVWQSQAAPNSAPWSMSRRVPSHQAVYQPTPDYDARVVSHTLPAFLAPGETRRASVTIENTGTATWTGAAGFALGAGATDPFAANMRLALGSAESVSPGQRRTFTFDLQAPTQHGYYTTEWRMLKNGGGRFGLEAFQHVKVGDEPALYVLTKVGNTQTGGVYPVGTAASLSPPDGYTNWPAAKSLAFLPDFRGYQLLDYQGGVWQGGTAQPIGGHGFVSEAREILLLRTGVAYYILDGYGNLSTSYGANAISPAPPTLSTPVARSAALTPDQRGVYVLDGYGHIYTGGTATALSPAIATFGADIAKRIKLTADGHGYYVLDSYGRVWSGGSAPSLTPNYTAHMGEDWARDLELTADGQGYYLLDKDGKIYTGGTAVAPQENLLPAAYGQDAALDLVVADSRASSGFSANLSAVDLLMDAQQSRSLTIRLTVLRGQVTWTAVSDRPWLSLNTGSGSTPSDLVITVSAEQAGIGSHQASIVLTPSGGQDGPVTIPVRIRVVPELHSLGLPLVVR